MAVTRQNFSSGTKWEPVVGYSRAVRVGNVIHISGTTPQTPAQYRRRGRCLRSSRADAQEYSIRAGARRSNHARRGTHSHVRDEHRCGLEKVGRAHGEFFSEIRPATSMVEVSKLISPKMLVELKRKR